MQHAVKALLASELFKYHTERMLGIVMVEAQEVSQLTGLPSDFWSQKLIS